ncbi:MAG: YdcF family protein, partial [Candidatus Electrothrix sp. AR4]|nr:YdcF family protein [Candidatus Electrothrix sp. AR4]
MSHVLSKLLPLIVYPLGIVISLSLSACLLLWIGKRRIAVLFLLLSISVLWVSSMRKTAEFVMGSLER